MRRDETRPFIPWPQLRRLSAVLISGLAAAGASLAVVPECASANASPAAFDPGPRPSVTEAVRLERFALPPLRPTAGDAISFWDFVPAEFYLALGRTKQQVESMTVADWDAAFVAWHAVRRWDSRLVPTGGLARAHRQIDWLYAMARRARALDDDGEFSADARATAAIDPEFASYARLLHGKPSPGTLWLMVAALYADARLAPPAPGAARSTWMLDRRWHDFPSESANVRVSQNDALRRYLCGHPDVLYLTRRAERMQQSDDPALKRQGAADLAAIDAYVAGSMDDFREFFDLLDSPAHRANLRTLAPAGESVALDQMIDTEGAAKAFLQMRRVVLDTVDLEGEFGSRPRIWARLPAHVRYAWPDRCLPQARYPVDSSPILGTPWVFNAPCDAPSFTREQVLQSAQEVN